MTPEELLNQKGYVLKKMERGSRPLIPWVRTGNLLYLSGAGPNWDGKTWQGQLGKEYTTAEGYDAALGCALNLLSAAQSALDDLSRVRQVIKVLGMVNCIPGWTDQPLVVNGCSDLFVAIFGERGQHARSAIGMAGLPGGIPVEIEVIFEVD